jgi:TonB family protein
MMRAARSSRRLAFAAAALALGAAKKDAEPATWSAHPTNAQVEARLPADVRSHWSGGRALMRCHVTEAGALENCAPLGENPPGSGAAAALGSLADAYRMAPAAMVKLPPDRRFVVGWSDYKYDREPDWRRKPTTQELWVLWPPDAARKNQKGGAIINCLVDTEGAPRDCVVEQEDPPGLGFGDAALGLAPQFIFKPATRKGQPVISSVRIPIKWEEAEGMPLGRPLVDPHMIWLRQPGPADIAAAYPRRARAQKRPGRANLSCKFGSDGHVHDCRILLEDPVGEGFGNAAMEVASRYVAPGRAPDGKAIDAFAVHLSIDFDPAVLNGAESAPKP